MQTKIETIGTTLLSVGTINMLPLADINGAMQLMTTIIISVVSLWKLLKKKK